MAPTQDHSVQRSVEVIDTVNFPPGTPINQANSAVGNVKVTWRP